MKSKEAISNVSVLLYTAERIVTSVSGVGLHHVYVINLQIDMHTMHSLLVFD